MKWGTFDEDGRSDLTEGMRIRKLKGGMMHSLSKCENLESDWLDYSIGLVFAWI